MTLQATEQSQAKQIRVPKLVSSLTKVFAAITIIGSGIWLGQKAHVSYQVHEGIDNIPQLFGQGEYDQARNRLEKLIAQSPNNAELHRLLGRVLSLIAIFRRDENAKQESVRVLERSVQLDPLSAPNWFELAGAYALSAQHQKAEVTYQKTLERDPYNSEYLFYTGFYFERNQQPKKAIKYYKASLAVRQDEFVQNAITRVEGTP